MKKFIFYWMDGSYEESEGFDVREAFEKLRYWPDTFDYFLQNHIITWREEELM